MINFSKVGHLFYALGIGTHGIQRILIGGFRSQISRLVSIE